MSSTDTGMAAEGRVAHYLQESGYIVIARNWKTARCEIDIVAKKAGTVYLIEVKYRSSSAQGTGFTYITSAKLKQMRFAAEVWAASNKYDGNYELLAAEVDAAGAIELVAVD